MGMGIRAGNTLRALGLSLGAWLGWNWGRYDRTARDPQASGGWVGAYIFSSSSRQEWGGGLE